MLFNSYAFIFAFLPVVLIVYAWLNTKNMKSGLLWLLFASLAFYGYWNPKYLPLILTSILFNFYMGRSISAKRSLAYLWIAIVVNLVLLGYFKYTDFFIENINAVVGTAYELQRIVLPLGISFFTFTQIAYLVASYRGEIPCHDGWSYALFVTYFPHLLAGPIIHYEEMMPQFLDPMQKILRWDRMSKGLFLFILGLAKKVLLADPLGVWVDAVFQSAQHVHLTMLEAWVGSLSYTFQLYFDFSGYTDMAIGMSLMFNIHLPENFNSPYKATSIIDFWRRWHMTLSTFLRDYLYIPLGGSRKGTIRKYLNLLLTMLLGGLWHGANWTFVLWGGVHGIALCVNHLFHNLKLQLPRFLCIGLTFFTVNLAWVFFRAENIVQAWQIVSSLFAFHHIGLSQTGPMTLPDGRKEGIFLLFLYLIVLWCPNSKEIQERFQPNLRWAMAGGILFLLSLLSFSRSTAFLYYQF